MARTTQLRAVLAEIKQRLLDENIYNATTVYIGRPSSRPRQAPSTEFCVISPGRQRAEQHENFLIEGEVSLTLWNLVELDEAERGNSQLLDDTLGLLRKADEVTAALELHDLESSAFLLAEPMRLKDQSEPKEDPENPEWLSITLTFEIRWEWSI